MTSQSRDPISKGRSRVKRSFYEMLDVPRDASPAELDIAFRQATARLQSGTSRGAAAAVAEAKLIKDGHHILSDPDRRARYDAKLLADETEVKVTFFPDDSYGRRRLGIGTVALVVLSTILGTIIYRNLAVKMDEVRVEHVQAVAKRKEEQPKPVVIDTIYSHAPLASKGANDRENR